jgi:hypothetical protein
MLVIDTLEPRTSFADKDELQMIISRGYRVSGEIVDPDQRAASAALAERVKQRIEERKE